MMDPWDENGIFTYIFGCLFFMVNVGNYTSPMDGFWVLEVMMSCKHSATGDTSGR